MFASKHWVLTVLVTLLPFLYQVSCDYARVTSYDLMKCSYGERGSLTATCVNATPNFFKSTLYKFDHLDETLRCINCTLTIIESNTFDLSGNQIKELDLQNSQIETLRPKAFMGLIFLKTLNMSHNKIRSIFPGTFIGTKKISTLDLSNNEITLLAESGFAELIELENLILRQNQIKVIDVRAFNGLVKLRTLDLSSNFISAFNNSLENVTSLESINLSDNNIQELSGQEFFPLTKLSEIDLSRNALSDKVAFNMTPGNQLRKISLVHNKINRFWFEVFHLELLEELDLESNDIGEISDTPSDNLHNLHTLNLALNKLTEIATGQFTGLPQLRILNCSHNSIAKILITGVFSIPNLHSLDLSHNNLTDLDYTALISRVPTLSYLRLEDNMLPCDLERDMDFTFAEDNFKYVLYDNVVGAVKCSDKSVVRSEFPNSQTNAVWVDDISESLSSADITIFIFISLIIAAIGILFYLQFLFYKGIQLTGPKRVSSTVQLIPSENDHQRENDFENITP